MEADVDNDTEGDAAPDGAAIFIELLDAYSHLVVDEQDEDRTLPLTKDSVLPGNTVADEGSVTTLNNDDDHTHEDSSAPMKENISEHRNEVATSVRVVTALSVSESNRILIIRPSVVNIADTSVGGVGLADRLLTKTFLVTLL
jgi:hypothetical protein